MWSFQFRLVWFVSGFSLARALGSNKLPFPPTSCLFPLIVAAQLADPTLVAIIARITTPAYRVKTDPMLQLYRMGPQGLLVVHKVDCTRVVVLPGELRRELA